MLRCGPHKLAKAFAFCLGKASQLGTDRISHTSPLPMPLGPPDSPQRLFALSPRSSHPQWQYSQDEYFPTNVLSPVIASSLDGSAISTADSRKTDTLKPVLLLVEDNKINLKVRRLLHSLSPTHY
jgi:hypothetical protein